MKGAAGPEVTGDLFATPSGQIRGGGVSRVRRLGAVTSWLGIPSSWVPSFDLFPRWHIGLGRHPPQRAFVTIN